MSADLVVVGVCVVLAAGYLLRRVLLARRAERQRGNGCDNCGH
jgi:hypothetical protein